MDPCDQLMLTDQLLPTDLYWLKWRILLSILYNLS